MQLNFFPLRISALLFSLLFLLIGYAHSAPINVLVSVVPQQYFAQKIGGERVHVTVLVGPGRSAENYEPSIRQLSQLSKARLFWSMGLPFEEVLQISKLNDTSEMTVLDARQGVHLRVMEDMDIVLAESDYAHQSKDHHDERYGHEHEHQGSDPHFWLNPRIVKHMGAEFKNTLVQLDPEHRDEYEANYRLFANELDQLDAQIKAQLASSKQRRFMVFHPAWGYFADAYDLRQLPIEIEGKTPGPKTLAAMIQLAREQQIKVIFVQQQFSQRDAQVVAKAIDGRVIAVDPLAADYPENLRRVAQAFAEAMQ